MERRGRTLAAPPLSRRGGLAYFPAGTFPSTPFT